MAYFLNLLKLVGKLKETDFNTLLKTSGIGKETLEKMLEMAFSGLENMPSLINMESFSDGSRITLTPFGEDVAKYDVGHVLDKYDEKFQTDFSELSHDNNFRTAKSISIKSNMKDAVISFADDKPTINPALSYTNDTIYLTQKLPMNVVQEVKGVGKTVTIEMPVIIFCNGAERGVITIDQRAMETLEVDGLRLRSIPLNVKNRWSIESIKAFLEDTADAKNYSLMACFDAVKEQYKKFMEFKEEWHYDLIAIWCMGTYFHEIFASYPYIFLNAVKRSGKSKTLNLTGCMAFNSINALTMTPSSLFRIVESTKATVLIDEIENLNKKDTGDMRTLLLAGYKKGTEVPRVEEKKSSTGMKAYGVPTYQTFSPKIMANISGIEDVLEDRCIGIVLNRGSDKHKMNREIDAEDEKWQEVRDMLYNCLMFNFKQVAERNVVIVPYLDTFYDENKSEIGEMLKEPEAAVMEVKGTQSTLGDVKTKEVRQEIKLDIKEIIDSVIKGRGFELWRPVFTIASLINEHMLMNIFVNAVKHEKSRREEDITETLDSILVELLLELVEGVNFYRVRDITNKLKETNPDDEKWLSTRWVGRALKRLGLAIEKKRQASGVMIKIAEADVKKVAEKLGISVVEPINIMEKEKHKPQTEIIMDTIIELEGEGGGEIKEHVLVKELDVRGVTNVEQKLAMLKERGAIFNPTPTTIRRI
jgi:hypothetical protein